MEPTSSDKWEVYEQEFSDWLDHEIESLQQKLEALEAIKRKLIMSRDKYGLTFMAARVHSAIKSFEDVSEFCEFCTPHESPALRECTHPDKTFRDQCYWQRCPFGKLEV